VILCDIDHFKAINDSLGHDAGDAVLCEVAGRLRDRLRAQDRLARWGGEEFLVLLPETDRDGAVLVAESLRKQMEETPARYEDQEIAVTLSFGVAALDPGRSVEESIRQADDALYEGKRAGRNRVMAAAAEPVDS
jgi:diguanylate cyclase (GGDEF)-like protein